MEAIADIRSVTYKRSARAKHLRITLRPDRTVVITIPRGASLEEAQDFLASRRVWLRKHLQRLEAQERLPEDPELQDIDLEQVQTELFERLDFFSKQYNLPYRRATFRCQKTKWGSCSSKGNINLNINIAFLPRHLQDYILLHELVHLKITNHSPAYWSELDKYCGGRAKALSKEMRKYRMKIVR